MNDIDDVINWFGDNRFIINPLITIAVVGGRFSAPRILAILIKFDKNVAKRQFRTKSSYMTYLRS